MKPIRGCAFAWQRQLAICHSRFVHHAGPIHYNQLHASALEEFVESDLRSVGRHTNIAKSEPQVIDEYVPDRIFDPGIAADLAHDGELGAIGRPIGGEHVIEQWPHAPAGNRSAHEIARVIRIRQFILGRNGQQTAAGR